MQTDQQPPVVRQQRVDRRRRRRRMLTRTGTTSMAVVMAVALFAVSSPDPDTLSVSNAAGELRSEEPADGGASPSDRDLEVLASTPAPSSSIPVDPPSTYVAPVIAVPATSAPAAVLPIAAAATPTVMNLRDRVAAPPDAVAPALPAAVVPASPDAVAPASPVVAAPSPLPPQAPALGVYLGGGPKAVGDYEQWLGTDVTYVLDFWGAGDDWSKIEDPSWLARRWQQTDQVAVRSIAMLPNDRTSLAAGAAGDYDRYWKSFAETFVALGEGDAIIRLGWEFNGRFYPWAAGGKEKEYAEYWRRIVDVTRSVPGAEFSFDWTPLGGNVNADVELAYPGDDYVDFIGLDAYDASPVAEPAARWADVRDRTYGLAWHRDFATAHGKPMTFPEWGLTLRYSDDLGGGDNPQYLANMHRWITENDVAYAMYFETDAKDARHRLMSSQFPRGSEVFRDLFGP